MLRRILVFAIGATMVAGLAVHAGDEKPDSKKDSAKELKAQTHCPVMGGKIDSTVYTDIQGHRVYHCCPACIPKIKADPDKYFKKAAAEGVLFENIQVMCPVSGEKLEAKTVYSDYEGRRVYFCCKKCQGMFDKNPKKFIKELDATMPSTKPEDKKPEEKTGHEGHGHGH